jgi:hypothetical protein
VAAQWLRHIDTVNWSTLMVRLYDHDGLVVTDDWIRTPTGQYKITDVLSLWMTRPGVGRRWFTYGLTAGVTIVLLAGAGLTGWLTRNWLWLLATPVILLGAGAVGLLDPVAIYLEKRPHELWIMTPTGAVRVFRANAVEVGKAMRQINRARQRLLDDAYDL